MSVRVKICGVSRPEALEAATASGADWIGLVFFPRSPRALTPRQAATLVAGHVGPPLIGLFVEPAEGEIEEALAQVPLAGLQLYTAPSRAAALRRRFGLPVWRATPVAVPPDLPLTGEGVDMLLVEPRPAADASRPGGNGTILDWSILRGWSPPLPWLLGGGLAPENVARAIRASGATAVDVSSGVESLPGVKSPALIHAFIAAARGAA